MNDWFLKFELKTVRDVAEVASIGGMVRQYQVVLDADRMRASRPFVFSDMKRGEGVSAIVDFLRVEGGL